jgi:hypothetical protein
MIFPTLAFQLACQYPHFRQKLLEVLKERPDVGHESLCSQMEKLLVRSTQSHPPQTLIIIDALDECKDKEPASAILSVLSRYVDQIIPPSSSSSPDVLNHGFALGFGWRPLPQSQRSSSSMRSSQKQ